jgi:AcrR family transcriptional regulator
MRLGSLTLVAFLCGVATAAAYRRFTNRDAASCALKRLIAHLQEIRLYADEPALIWRAQIAALRESARLFVTMIKPSLMLALPMAWLLVQFDAGFGHALLPLNEPAMVTVHLTRELNAGDAAATLTAPPEIAVETPPVRVLAEREISWRVRPARAVHGSVVVRLGEDRLAKSIAAGPDWWWVSPCRFRRILAVAVHPWDGRLPADDVKWISTGYPEVPWFGWFLVFSTLGAALELWRR